MNWLPPDSFHLQAAQGWLELGNWQEANDELEQITPKLRAHPDALKLRVDIYSAAERWEEAAIIAESLAKLIPDEPFPYIRAAFALHELQRTEEALNVLLPVADRKPASSSITARSLGGFGVTFTPQRARPIQFFKLRSMVLPLLNLKLKNC